MSHFMSTASQTLSDSSKVALAWRDRAQRDALRYPFLMHGMLALSALHLSSTMSEEKLRFARLCRHHMILGIPAFRQTVANMTTESWGPCFLMSMLLGSLQIAAISDNAPSDVHGKAVEVTLEDLLGLFTMVKGMMEIQGREAPPYGLDARSKGRRSTPVAEEKQVGYGELKTKIIGVSSQDEAEICADALDKLKDMHGATLSEDGPFDPYHIARWASRVTSSFVALLQTRNKGALLVLSHCIELVEGVEDQHWTLKGWGRNGTAVINSLIDETANF